MVEASFSICVATSLSYFILTRSATKQFCHVTAQFYEESGMSCVQGDSVSYYRVRERSEGTEMRIHAGALNSGIG